MAECANSIANCAQVMVKPRDPVPTQVRGFVVSGV